jgi:peptide/nickel transport system permease protein
MLSLLIAGTRVSMEVGFAAALVAMLIGGAVGVTSGFVGGIIVVVLMRITDIFLVIPDIPLMIVMAAVFGRSLKNIIMLAVLMAVLDWPALSRQVRSQVLSLRQREYIEAARMLDLGTPAIIFRELLPNMMSFVAISTIFEMTHAIYQVTGLVFLGIVPYSGANWGVMIQAAQLRGVLFNKQAAWSILAPMGAIVLFQLALVSFARSLDEMFNPRLRTSV